jgi:hypothetical protein
MKFPYEKNKIKRSQRIKPLKKVPQKTSRVIRVLVITFLVIGFIAILLFTYFISQLSVNTIHK